MWLLLISRAGVIFLGLTLVFRWIFKAQAYNSWRAMLYFGLAAASLVVHLAAEAYALLAPNNPPILADVGLGLASVGLVGLVWEKWQADQLRQKSAQKLLDQWRLASNQSTRRARELEILSEINSELASSLNLRDVLQMVVDRARNLSDADAVTIFARNPETGELTDYHVSAASQERLRRLPSPRNDGLTASVARTGQEAFIADARTHPMYAGRPYPDLGAIASLPMRLEDQVVGVMNVGFTHKHEFDDGEMRLLTALADAAALAVNNAALHERIAKLAVTDELTGLANRRRFLDTVRTEIQRARRYQRPLTVMMVDLDRLKQINDQDGHPAGDAMLRGVAQCLRASVRDTDLPARLGGDEFAVLLPETLSGPAVVIAERIRQAVETFRTTVNDKTIHSTVSIGLVSRHPGDLQDLPSLIRLADDALYKSKTQGRNQVTLLELPAPQD